jgi:hypothetical protein
VIDLDLINSLTGGFDGVFNVVCPLCGPVAMRWTCFQPSGVNRGVEGRD